MSGADPYAPRPLARWYYAGALAAVLFMLLGVLVYVEHVTLDAATLPVDQRAKFLAQPQWVTGVFAVATWSGLAGALLLLLRRRTAETILLVSLVAIAVWIGGLATTEVVRASMSVNDWALLFAIAAIVWTIYWFARHSRQRGWLR
ncbi:MAG: hypothetical protein ABIP07_07890 [Sphingomicrobium sp.]